MSRLIALALLIALPAFATEYIMLWYGVLDRFHPNLRLIIGVALAVPLIEETARFWAVQMGEEYRWIKRGTEVSISVAVGLGLLLGTIEIGTKSLMLATSNPENTLLTVVRYLSHVSSLPIHVALSCAFFSFKSHRYPKTLALHAFINTSVIVDLIVLERFGLKYDAAPVARTIALLAMVTAVSLLFAFFSIRRMARQRTGSRSQA